MRRITISLDPSLARLAEAEVAAGRAPSVSAWVADAIRAKARARAELIADLEALERSDRTPAAVLNSVARSLGLPVATVERSVRRRRSHGRARRAA